jgi:3-hydroxyisobutyrate dehydrogenase-like beta-hydroxyacid dehydrogenase
MAAGAGHVSEPLVVTVLGLGEAGSRLSADLAAAGADVRGYDPAPAAGTGVADRRPDPVSAVAGSDVVLNVTAAAVALESARAALPGLAPDTIYADLNTGSPELKRALAELVAGAAVRFADVALLGPVPARGLQTPALAAGPGAADFAGRMTPLGMSVEVVSETPGDAAALKLLRSVFMKGLAAAALESLGAAEAAGHAAWLEAEIAEVIGAPLLERLLTGSRLHAGRRADEMTAATELLTELGIEPRITSASAALLAELAADRPS